MLERISVEAITADGTTIKDLRVGAIGASLKDLGKKCFAISTVAHDNMHIECNWKKGQDGKLICTSINGASEIVNRNCKIANIDFESGNIRNFADSIRADFVIDEEYQDPSIILDTLGLSEKEEQLSKLEAEERKIAEAEALVKRQKEGQIIGE